MQKNIKISIKNYKPFDSTGFGFDSLELINVIIGKNNSGKSSLLEVVKFIVDGNSDLLNNHRNGKTPEVEISHILQDDDIKKVFDMNTHSHGGAIGNHYQYGRNFIGHQCCYSLKENNVKNFLSVDKEFENTTLQHFQRLPTHLKNPIEKKIFCHISAERDIVPEGNNSAKEIAQLIMRPNGNGATNLIQQITNKTKYDSNIVEGEMLGELNKIVNPDINFTRILTQINDDENWEIFFEDEKSNRIALSKMGSGVKTIILVLLNLIVRPKFEKKPLSHYVFAFEELENNLHPSMQRRLYNYIKNYATSNKVYFFITTHSNIVIDLFGSFSEAQLIHVFKEGEITKVKPVTTFDDNKSVLRDLDIKASDLLQSNGIIWVEGPSDRSYLNRWIELTHPNLVEGVHYSIMFYGGRLLSNTSFDYEWFNKEIIPLIKINTNAFVVMDRDGKGINDKLNTTKQRISDEIGENNFWITQGREIENYLLAVVINEWLTEKGQLKSNFEYSKDEKIEISVGASTKNKVKYNENKTVYSQEISKHITKKSMDILDLRAQIENLVKKIKEWNSMQ